MKFRLEFGRAFSPADRELSVFVGGDMSLVGVSTLRRPWSLWRAVLSGFLLLMAALTFAPGQAQAQQSTLVLITGLPNVLPGASFSRQLVAQGGSGNYLFEVVSGSLPPDITLSPDGLVAGTAPPSNGLYSFTIRVSDRWNWALPKSQFYQLIVGLGVAGNFSPGQVGQPFSQRATAVGGQAPYTFSLDGGALPAGLSLASDGLISGTPTAAGRSTFQVRVSDANGHYGSQSLSIRIDAFAMTPIFRDQLVDGVAYSRTITATGGTAPYTFDLVSGSFPLGLTLAPDGVISGVPTEVGVFTAGVRATDASGASFARAYGFNVASSAIVVTPAEVPVATVGRAYNMTFSANGGTAPYSYSIASGTLPAGINLSSTGQLSGTASDDGAFNFRVQATDANGGTGFQRTSLVVERPELTFSASGLPVGRVGSHYRETVSTNGVGQIQYELTGALPPGITMGADFDSAYFTGVPTTAGTYPLTLKATDTRGYTATVSFDAVVEPKIIDISPTTLPDAIQGLPYAQRVTVTGGTAPYQFQVYDGLLPLGLQLASDGMIFGIPQIDHPQDFGIEVTDANGATARAQFTLTIAPRPAFTFTLTPAPSTAAIYTPYSGTLSPTGGVGPYTYEVASGSLPPGLTLNAGVISGTPAKAGSYMATIRAQDANGWTGLGQYRFQLRAPTITLNPALPAGIGGTAYAHTVSASGGMGPYTYDLLSGTLPAGLGLSSAGVLSGTPTAAFAGVLTIRATDANGHVGQHDYDLRIEPPVIAIGPATLADGNAGEAYSATLSASGGVAPHAFEIASGSLPAGLSLTSAGELSGTPTQAGAFPFTVRATDANGFQGEQALTLAIQAPTVTLMTTSLPAGLAGTAYDQSLSASGGVAPYSYALASGALPAGLNFSNAGVLSGTPTVAGAFNLSIRVTDANGFSGEGSLTLQVAAPPITLTTADLPAGLAGTVYEQTLTASGGVAPYRYALDSGALPAGLTLSSAGVFSGAPTVAGTFALSVRATDANGFSGAKAYSLVIAAPVLTLAPTALPAGREGTIYSQSVAAAGGVGPYAYTVADGALPAGLTLSAEGNVSGTPTAAGSYPVSIRATDANGFTIAAPFTMLIESRVETAAPVVVDTVAGQSATVDLTTGATGGPFTGATLVSLSRGSSGQPRALAAEDLGTAQILNPSAGRYVLVITPAPTFSGRLVATYTLSNGASTSAPGTVSIVVVARPDPTLDPEVTGLIAAQGETARRFANAQVDNINGRLESLHSGGGVGLEARIGFSGGSQEFDYGLDRSLRRPDLSAMDTLALSANGASTLAGQTVAGTESERLGLLGGNGGSTTVGRFGLWASGVVDFGRRDAGSTQEGAKFTTSGLTAGLDYRLNETLTLGVALGYGRDESRVGGNDTRSEADGYSLSGYGSFRPSKAMFVDGVLGYGVLDLQSRRYVAATDDFIAGERDGNQWFSSIRVGTNLEHGQWRVSPFGRLTVTRSVLEAFAEAEGGVHALAYDEQVVRTTTGGVGVLLDNSHEVRFGWLKTRLRLEYAHDFQGASRAGLSYADWLNGPTYQTMIAPVGDDRLTAGLGLNLLHVNGVDMGFDYQLGLADDLQQHQVRLTVRAPF